MTDQELLQRLGELATLVETCLSKSYTLSPSNEELRRLEQASTWACKRLRSLKNEAESHKNSSSFNAISTLISELESNSLFLCLGRKLR
jgi:hypothetical protein